MTRFWHTTERAEKLDFDPMSAGEGVWVSHWLEKNLGGTPSENSQAYIEYSPYTYTAENVDNLGGNAQYLKDIPIRTYAEPDINWHIKNRRRTYYSMNATDMASLVSDLKLIGNKETQFVSTHNKRDDVEGTTHTWSIVKKKLMKWFASYIEKK